MNTFCLDLFLMWCQNFNFETQIRAVLLDRKSAKWYRKHQLLLYYHHFCVVDILLFKMMIVNFAHFSLKQNIFSGLQKDRDACIRENTVTQPLSVVDPGEAPPVCTHTPQQDPILSFTYRFSHIRHRPLPHDGKPWICH